MKNLKKKDGFTLVEMLIVIFIVAMLSTMAINGYTQYRRSSLLDFSVDSFISKFYELKENTVRGDFGGKAYDKIVLAIEDPDEVYDPENDPDAMSDAKCYGFYFVNEGGDSYLIKEIDVPYSNKKTLDGGVYKEVGCEYPQNFGTVEYPLFGMDEAITVLGLYGIDEDGNELDVDNFLISFVPPKGDIEYYNLLTEQVEDFFEEIRLQIKYGESDQDEFKRNVFMNLKSIQSYIKRPENAEEN